MKHFCITTLLIICALISYSQKMDKTVTYLYDETIQPPEMFIDVTHLKAEIFNIMPLQKHLDTRSTYSFIVLRNQVDSLVLTANTSKVTMAKIDNKSVNYRQIGDKLIIYTPFLLSIHSKHELYLEQNTTCNNGMPAFTGWDDTTGTKRKQIWGFSLTNIIADFGIKHDLLTTELIVKFDSKYKVFSNGTRIAQKKNNDNTTTWHYLLKNKHYFGLLVFGIGDYNYKSFTTPRGTPLEYWYYSDQEKSFEPTYRYSREMFTFLENEFGVNYPWELYRQLPIIDCPFGGMETTTTTIFNDGMLCDSNSYNDKNYINVNVHELIHQWFGNFNSYTNGHNIWTSESFATYFSKKFEQAQFGDNQYQKIRHDELIRTYNAAKVDDYPIGSVKGLSPRWYPKGSLVLDMLRDVMGENEFKTFIPYYLKKHAYGIVEWNDIKIAIRESTGQTLDWFFDQWILRGGEPEYTISYVELKSLDNLKNTHIKVKQTHFTNELIGFFKMPITTHVYYTDGTFDEVTSWVEKEFSEIVVPNKNNKKVSFVVFDPNRKILKKIIFKRSVEELVNQLKMAKNMIDRFDALLELKNIAIDVKRDALIESFYKEDFHLIKSEIISQLADDNHPNTIKMMKSAITDVDIKVRKVVSIYLKNIPNELQFDYEQLLKDSSYQLTASALENLINSFPKNANQYLNACSKLKGNVFYNIKIKWLELAFEQEKKNQYLIELREFCNIERYDNNTVITAIQAVKRLNYLDENLVRYLFKAGKYWSDPINSIAKTTLEYFYEQNEYRKIIKLEYAKLNDEAKMQWKTLIK